MLLLHFVIELTHEEIEASSHAAHYSERHKKICYFAFPINFFFNHLVKSITFSKKW